MRPAIIFLAVATIAPAARAQAVVLDDFTTTDAWTLNNDGGIPSVVALDATTFRSAPSAMRVTYTNAPPQWSNLVRGVSIPPDAVELTLRLYKHSADAGAAMHLWLMEADNDAWNTRVLDDGKTVGAMSPGWHDIHVPIGSFQFDPRGPGSRDMTSVNRMLLGCNFADLDVTVDDLTLVSREAREGTGAMQTAEAVVLGDGPRGRVVVLNDALPAGPGASDPVKLGDLLAKAGFGVTYITGAQLALPSTLDPQRVDVLMLPYGPLFPVDAAEPLRAYLKGGGSVFCTGGYAFDEPVWFREGRWQPVGGGLSAKEVSEGTVAPATQINTRNGKQGDTMQFDPDQLQLFDPMFLLRRTSRLRAADGQSIVAPNLAADMEVEGYSAVSTLGSHSPVFPSIYGRRIPLVEAVDGYGRLRGTVGAIIHHNAGPYAGGSFAIFGATNVDLFTGEDAPLAPYLADIVEALARPTYIRRLTTSEPCYYDGEQVVVRAEPFAAAPTEDARLVVRVASQPEKVVPDALAGAAPIEITFPLPEGANPCKVEADLYVGARRVDHAETAFCVWREADLGAGLRIERDGSYFAVNGRRTVLEGTNETGFVWFSQHEDPLVWDRDFAAMRDHGVNILRLLHFSPFSEGGYEGKSANSALALANRPDKLRRQTDALVLLAQKHSVIIFLSLHDWMDVGLSDEEYAAQRDWDRFWCERYRDVPGVIYDIQNEPSIGDPPDSANLVRLYNDLLAERYGDTAGVAAAWGMDPGGELPSIPIRREGGAWDSVPANDYWRFKMAVYNKWVGENAAGIKEGDPNALLTVGHLNWNANADKQTGARHVDFTNTHFYGSLIDFAQTLKFSDRRFEGKPFSVGEFGAQEAHQQRNAGGDGARDAESIRRFLWFGHYTFGLGGSFLCNWSWKDFEGAVFPWGIRYLEDDVSKDVLLAYRAQALLFRRLEPEYIPPAVYVVMPDSLRFSPIFGDVDNAMRRAFTALYHAGVPFGLLGEWDLAHLPGSAQALVWPIPYCPSDETFDVVRGFVERGGALYLSGDVGFDEFRRPTRAARLAQLNLPDIAHVGPVDAQGDAADAETSRVGRGNVYFVPFPVELRGSDADIRRHYAAFLAAAGVECATPADPPGQVLRVPLAGGGHADVLSHFAETGGSVDVSTPEFTAPLAPLEVALTAVNAEGELFAAHVPSSLTARDGRAVVSGDVHVLLGSLTDQPLSETDQAFVAPLNPGRTTLDIMPNVRTALLLVGDVVDGRFVTHATQQVDRGAQGFVLEFDADAALSLCILCAPGAERTAITTLERELCLTQ